MKDRDEGETVRRRMKRWKLKVKRRVERAAVIPARQSFEVCVSVCVIVYTCVSVCVLSSVYTVCGLFMYVCLISHVQ